MQQDKISSAKELLLADYTYLCGPFWKNREYFDEYGILSGYDPFGGFKARDIQVRKIVG